MSVAPGSISLVDDEDDEEGGLLGGVGDSDDRPGAGESSREGSRVSRVDRVWEVRISRILQYQTNAVPLRA